ncbi:MAG: hypothetical protein C0507_10150 [Cyanobacteria bacterium PR.3.49]|nr:hypothetical protein [Cyanobacteria bacterium PR.3.49]
MQTAEKQAQARNWGAVRLTSGFYMTDMVRSVLPVVDTEVRALAIQRVIDLLESGCADEHQWRHSIDELCGLLREHPDAHKESGTWYDGDPTILALATAKEAASHALYKLYPTLYCRGEAEGASYKVLKYMIRAMMQNPQTAASCLKWVERNVSIMQRW